MPLLCPIRSIWDLVNLQYDQNEVIIFYLYINVFLSWMVHGLNPAQSTLFILAVSLVELIAPVGLRFLFEEKIMLSRRCLEHNDDHGVIIFYHGTMRDSMGEWHQTCLSGKNPIIPCCRLRGVPPFFRGKLQRLWPSRWSWGFALLCFLLMPPLSQAPCSVEKRALKRHCGRSSKNLYPPGNCCITMVNHHLWWENSL